MAQIDLSGKNLLGIPDIFADILNVFIYRGKQVITPDMLLPASTESIYTGRDNKLHNQFSDLGMYRLRDNDIQTLYLLENEVAPLRKTVFRQAGYEGAAYRRQLHDKQAYPVVSLLLYWGRKPWRQPLTIRSYFRNFALDEELRRYIGPTKLHVFQMRRLSKEVRTLFRSDLRLVADYLAEGKELQDSGQNIVHVEEFLLFMHALTGDKRYMDDIPEFLQLQTKKGGIGMCDLLDKYENKGRREGIREGIRQGKREGIRQGKREGKREGILSSIRSLSKTLQIPAEQAMVLLELPEEDMDFYRARL